MENMIILKNTQVAMKSFAAPFYNHFGLNLNKKKRVVIRAMRKKLNIFIVIRAMRKKLNIFMLQLLIYNIVE